MSLLTTKTARSMMYLICIGGLLVCNGFIVMVVWNDVLLTAMNNDHHLSFLEGTGITAFAYVIVFAVKYGRAERCATRSQEQTVASKCAGMALDQRTALRNELIQSCGCQETVPK